MKVNFNTIERVKIGSLDNEERKQLIERMKNDLQFVNNEIIRYNMIKCICTWKNKPYCNIPKKVNDAIQWLHKDKNIYYSLFE